MLKAKELEAALGISAVATYTKRVAAPTPVRIGDDRECDGGHNLDGWKKGFVKFVDRLSPQL